MPPLAGGPNTSTGFGGSTFGSSGANPWSYPGSNPYAQFGQNAQGALYGGASQGINYASGLEGQREGILNNLIGLNSIGGIQGQAAENANQIRQNAGQTGAQTGMELQGLGVGSGAVGGAVNSSNLQGGAAVNQSNQYFDNPQYESSVLGQGLNAVNQGQQNPLLGEMSSLEPAIQNQQTFNYQTQGQGLWGQIAPLIGAFLGGGGASGLGGLFGGGSGTTGQSNNPEAASPGGFLFNPSTSGPSTGWLNPGSFGF